MKKLQNFGLTAALAVLLASTCLTGCSSAPREVVTVPNQSSMKFGDVADEKTLSISGDPALGKESVDVIGDISAHNDPAFSNKRNVFHVLQPMKAVHLSKSMNPNIVTDDKNIFAAYFVVWDGQIYKISADKTVTPVSKMVDARGEQASMSGGSLQRTDVQLGIDLGKQRQVKVNEFYEINQDRFVNVTYSHSSSVMADWVQNQHAWMFYFADGDLYRVYGNGKYDVLSKKPLVNHEPDAFILFPEKHSNVEVAELTDDGKAVLIRESSHFTYESKYEMYRWNERTVDVIARYSDLYDTWYATIDGKDYFVQFGDDSVRVTRGGIILRAPSRLHRPQLFVVPNSTNTDAPPAVVPARPSQDRPVPVTPRRPSDDRPPVVLPSRLREDRPVMVRPTTANDGRPPLVSPSHTNDDRPALVVPKNSSVFGN